MTAKRVVCFGEIMMRLKPPGFQRLVQASALETTYAGAEANVAVSLAHYGMDAAYVTKLPDNCLGQAAVQQLRRHGVDTSGIVFGGRRLGVYYLEAGASQRPSMVLYDRAHSSMAEASVDDFDWAAVLQGADWFHVTGITPALGGALPAVTAEAARQAKRRGARVSCDLNFRKNLWTEEEAGRVMSSLMEHVDLLIANEEDAARVFGIHAQETDIASGQLSDGGYRRVCRKIMERFPSISTVAVTLRESLSATFNHWSAMLYHGGTFHKSRKYEMFVIDRVGGGDAFGGGLIYGMLAGFSMRDALEFAVASSCLKHSIPGDFNQVSVDEVRRLMDGDASGRVLR